MSSVLLMKIGIDFRTLTAAETGVEAILGLDLPFDMSDEHVSRCNKLGMSIPYDFLVDSTSAFEDVATIIRYGGVSTVMHFSHALNENRFRGIISNTIAAVRKVEPFPVRFSLEKLQLTEGDKPELIIRDTLAFDSNDSMAIDEIFKMTTLTGLVTVYRLCLESGASTKMNGGVFNFAVVRASDVTSSKARLMDLLLGSPLMYQRFLAKSDFQACLLTLSQSHSDILTSKAMAELVMDVVKTLKKKVTPQTAAQVVIRQQAQRIAFLEERSEQLQSELDRMVKLDNERREKEALAAAQAAADSLAAQESSATPGVAGKMWSAIKAALSLGKRSRADVDESDAALEENQDDEEEAGSEVESELQSAAVSPLNHAKTLATPVQFPAMDHDETPLKAAAPVVSGIMPRSRRGDKIKRSTIVPAVKAAEPKEEIKEEEEQDEENAAPMILVKTPTNRRGRGKKAEEPVEEAPAPVIEEVTEGPVARRRRRIMA